jgi:ABC-type uncharacterized transport system substrate-binding protein
MVDHVKLLNAVAAFTQALNENGFEVGKNLKVEWRFADGRYDQLPQMAADLVSRRVALIVSGSGPAALAAKDAYAYRKPHPGVMPRRNRLNWQDDRAVLLRSGCGWRIRNF